MGKIIVHLGAHRTATTSLQAALSESSEALRLAGLECLTPPRTRRNVFDGLFKRPSHRSEADIQTGKQSAKKLRNRFRRYSKTESPNLFLSEENLLGTMRDCRDCRELYPELPEWLSPYMDAFSHVDCMILGIRNTHHWWCSALSHTVAEYAKLPTPEDLDGIVAGNRSWNDVITDIRTCFPAIPLIVREHPYDTDSLGPDLAEQTGIEAFAHIRSVQKMSNGSANEDILLKKLEKRGADTNGLTTAMPGGVFDPFSDTQRQKLIERYENDIAAIQASTDNQLSFYPSKRKIRTRTSVKSKPPICLLHIGKTGGTFLRSLLQQSDNLPADLHLLNHHDTLESTRQKFGRNRQLAFVIREPKARFVSAFNSRLRQGRPTYNSLWSPAEAVAFQWFKDANALAEALGSDNERMRSASYFAMENIQHLRLNYQHFLTSIETLKSEKRNIRFCVDLTELDDKIPECLEKLGVADALLTNDAMRHAAPIAPEPLSELAARNLLEYWSPEFAIYDYCRENF